MDELLAELNNYLAFLESEQFQYWLGLEFFGNTMKSYLIALAVFLLIFFGLKYVKRFVLKRVKYITDRTATDIDDELVAVIEDIPNSFYYVLSLYLPLLFLNLPQTFDLIAKAIFVVVLVYNAIKTVQHLVDFVLRKHTSQTDEQGMAFSGINLIVNIALWTTGLLLVLSNLGFNVTSLVASLGIGGIAVALAVQNILGDVFSSFSIYFDKPFEIGDYIYLDPENQGIVKKIGLKTTRITTLKGQELVIANNDLTSRMINNYKKMKTRRVVVTLNLVYGTTSKKLEKALELIKNVIDSVEDVELSRVHFSAFSASSLDIELVYFVNSNEYMFYMDKNQEINFSIKKAFEKAKIEFAYPTQTIHLQK